MHVRFGTLSPTLSATLPEWALPVTKAQRLGAAAPAVRDITVASPAPAPLDTMRAGVTVADLLRRRGQLERLRGLCGAGPVADCMAARAAELHAILRDGIPEFSNVRQFPDLAAALAMRIPANEVSMQWLLPLHHYKDIDHVTMLFYAKHGDLVTGLLQVRTTDVLALLSELQAVTLFDSSQPVRTVHVFFKFFAHVIFSVSLPRDNTNARLPSPTPRSLCAGSLAGTARRPSSPPCRPPRAAPPPCAQARPSCRAGAA